MQFLAEFFSIPTLQQFHDRLFALLPLGVHRAGVLITALAEAQNATVQTGDPINRFKNVIEENIRRRAAQKKSAAFAFL